MNDVVLETVRVLVLGFICAYFWREGRRRFETAPKGWGLLLGGFFLLLFASALDVTDNFESLNRFVVIGDTGTEAFLEKVVGYLGGFVLIAIGLMGWMPAMAQLSTEISKRKLAEMDIIRINVELEERVAERNRRLEEELFERKRIEDVLRESERRTRSITDAVPGLIGYVDADRRYTFVNRRYEEWYGLPRNEIVGTHVHELRGDGDYCKVKRHIDAVLQGQEVSFEASRRFGDGVKRDYHSHFIPHTDDDGTVVGYFALTTDISDRKKAELAHEQMHQMQKMDALGQMAGGVAHEFNNLLTVIGGFARTALKRIEDPERVEECLQEVLAASDRAAEVSRQMLVFSRGQVGEAKVTTVGAELGGLEQMLKSLLESSIELEFDVGTERSTVEVNPSLFSQAVVNLAINARDAMPEGGKISIGCDTTEVKREFFSQLLARTVKPGRYVRIVVRDTGIGIGPETQERIFEPFFTTKESGTGTGLGLSIVLGMVKQSNGYIELESTVGSGTTFSIYLPACDKELTEKPPATVDDALGAGELILLVEDGTQLRNLAKMTLEDMGYRVLTAADGNIAIDLYDEHGKSVDLLVTDIVMPGMSGIRLADMVAEIRPEMKIVFVTGYAPELSSQLEPLDHNCLILRKPFEPVALGRIVRQALDA